MTCHLNYPLVKSTVTHTHTNTQTAGRGKNPFNSFIQHIYFDLYSDKGRNSVCNLVITMKHDSTIHDTQDAI